jgi:ADP-ribose pyrophosphatase YjhB (NUDIX family)
MPKLEFTCENIWDNELLKFEIYTSTNFDDFQDSKQSFGIVLNSDNQILLVSGTKEHWFLPGGGVEEGETLMDTLNREIYEESAIVLDQSSIKPLFFQKVYKKDEADEWKYIQTQARFVCRIERQDEFLEDPDCHDIKHQMFVDIKNLDKYLKWGKTTEFIQQQIVPML